MAADFQPPPTYAEVVVDDLTKEPRFNPIWLKWFVDIAAFISNNGGGGVITHNSLTGLQGGSLSERYHLTAAQASSVSNLPSIPSSYAVGDLLYASAASTLSKLADVAAGNALISGGVTTAPAWGKIGLTTHVSGTLAEGNGGTNQSTYTTGDLLYASAANTLSKLADVVAGSYLRSGGVTTAPLWSTLKLPNAATANYVAYATSTNTWGESANFQFNGSHLFAGNAASGPNVAYQFRIFDNAYTIPTGFAGIGMYLQTELSTSGTGSFESYNARPHANYSGTLSSLTCFHAQPDTVSVSCTITNYYGFKSAVTTEARMTNIYAFYGDTTAATGAYNFFANGTADNVFKGNVRLGGTTSSAVPTVACDVTGQIAATGSISKLGNVTTSGTFGSPAIVATGRSTAQTAAKASVSAFTVGASDGSFEVSANLNVTTSTLHNFTVTCAYTDETNTAQTVTLGFIQLAGATLITAITNVTGVGPYESPIYHLRCKASTAITIATTGTFTTVTYNAEGIIKQTA